MNNLDSENTSISHEKMVYDKELNSLKHIIKSHKNSIAHKIKEGEGEIIKKELSEPMLYIHFSKWFIFKHSVIFWSTYPFKLLYKKCTQKIRT